MSDVDLDEALSVAVDAAKRAGDIAMKHHKQDLEIRTKESATDYVTQVDGLAQKTIIEIIQKHFPDHRFIAEEEGAEGLGDPESPYEWIIDPLDGTIPFIHGKDNFGCLIALQKDSITQLGVVLLPMRNELFTAKRGDGALFNGKPIHLRKTKNLSDAVLCSNMVRRAYEEEGVLKITSPHCASLENYGSAAQEFSEVFLGHNDGLFFRDIPLWDIAAGCIVMEEAGGTAWYEPKDPSNRSKGNTMVASTGAIFDELKEWVDTKM